MAKLVGIAIKEGKLRPMIKLDQATVSSENGIESDFCGKSKKRQVTILPKIVWDEVCKELQVTLDWTSRRANLLIDEIDLENKIGSWISIGEVVLEITGETDPCSRMDEIHPGLKKVLEPNWRGGVTCRIIHGGIIAINDKVTFQSH